MHVITWNRLEKPDAAEAKLRLCPKISFGTKITATVFLLIFGIPAFETHPVLDILFLVSDARWLTTNSKILYRGLP